MASPTHTVSTPNIGPLQTLDRDLRPRQIALPDPKNMCKRPNVSCCYGISVHVQGASVLFVNVPASLVYFCKTYMGLWCLAPSNRIAFETRGEKGKGAVQVVVGRGRHGLTGNAAGSRTAGGTAALDSNALRKVVEDVCHSVRVRTSDHHCIAYR